MKLTGHTCPNCCAAINIPEGAASVKCKYCDSVFEVDNEKKAIEDAEEAGYKFEMGRQRAQREAMSQERRYTRNVRNNTYNAGNNNNGNNILLIIISIISLFTCCMYPLPITLFVSRSKNLNKAVKVIIIGLAWFSYIAFGCFAIVNSEDDEKQGSYDDLNYEYYQDDEESEYEDYDEDSQLDELEGLDDISFNNMKIQHDIYGNMQCTVYV